MSVNEIELSVRAANCLNNANITTVGQLAQKTEVAILEHFRFGLHRELANGGDVGVVQAVRRADAELDFVDAHVEQLLELGLFFVLLVGDFFEFDGVLVVADEDIEMMLQNGGGLVSASSGRDAAIGPDFENERRNRCAGRRGRFPPRNARG